MELLRPPAINGVTLAGTVPPFPMQERVAMRVDQPRKRFNTSGGHCTSSR
jgi:hypothetical protein